jgi:hypothetical protein
VYNEAKCVCFCERLYCERFDVDSYCLPPPLSLYFTLGSSSCNVFTHGEKMSAAAVVVVVMVLVFSASRNWKNWLVEGFQCQFI